MIPDKVSTVGSLIVSCIFIFTGVNVFTCTIRYGVTGDEGIEIKGQAVEASVDKIADSPLVFGVRAGFGKTVPLFILACTPPVDRSWLRAGVQAAFVAVKVNPTKATADVSDTLACLYERHFDLLKNLNVWATASVKSRIFSPQTGHRPILWPVLIMLLSPIMR